MYLHCEYTWLWSVQSLPLLSLTPSLPPLHFWTVFNIYPYRGSRFEASLAKSSKDPISSNSWVQWHVPVIPSHVGGWDQGDCGSRQARAKRFARPYLRKKLGVVVHTCPTSYLRKAKIGGSWSRQAWAEKWDPISKITRAKRAGGVAQVIRVFVWQAWSPEFKPQYSC
jgi:hypothetical protein